MTAPLRRDDPRRRVIVAVAAVVFLAALAYPVAFFSWYFTAEKVSARITECRTDQPHPLRCPTYGTWRLGNGTNSTGRIYGQDITREDVGRVVTARATRSWAVTDGVFASSPATYAVIAAVVDVVIVGMVVGLRAASRRR